MIYSLPDPSDPIRQGDIFKDIPRADISLHKLVEIKEDRFVETTWQRIIDAGVSSTTVAAQVKRVYAIIITQDCDALRSPDIALCEIGEFSSVLRVDTPSDLRRWVSLITRQTHFNLKWFYLPPWDEIGFRERMAVDFQSIIRASRDDLEGLRGEFRVGRLNDVAIEHFRERVGEFFRRYAYNEWYPFNKQEFEEYKGKHPSAVDIQPYDYQK